MPTFIDVDSCTFIDVHECPESKSTVDFSMVEARKEWPKEGRNSRKIGAF